MKYITFIAFALLTLFTAGSLYAAPKPTATPTVTPTPTKSPDEINKELLREKVATQLARLVQGTQKIFSGTIESKTDKELVVITKEGTLTVRVDENLTKWATVTSTRELKSADFKVGEFVTVDAIELDGVLNGNAVYKDNSYKVGHGNVSSVDADNNTLSVTKAQEQAPTELKLDKAVRVFLYNQKTQVLDKSRLDKVIAGDSVHYVQQKKGAEYVVTKLIVIPQELFISSSF